MTHQQCPSTLQQSGGSGYVQQRSNTSQQHQYPSGQNQLDRDYAYWQEQNRQNNYFRHQHLQLQPQVHQQQQHVPLSRQLDQYAMNRQPVQQAWTCTSCASNNLAKSKCCRTCKQHRDWADASKSVVIPPRQSQPNQYKQQSAPPKQGGGLDQLIKDLKGYVSVGSTEAAMDVEHLNRSDLQIMLQDLEKQLVSIPASLPQVRSHVSNEISIVKNRLKETKPLANRLTSVRNFIEHQRSKVLKAQECKSLAEQFLLAETQKLDQALQDLETLEKEALGQQSQASPDLAAIQQQLSSMFGGLQAASVDPNVLNVAKQQLEQIFSNLQQRTHHAQQHREGAVWAQGQQEGGSDVISPTLPWPPPPLVVPRQQATSMAPLPGVTQLLATGQMSATSVAPLSSTVPVSHMPDTATQCAVPLPVQSSSSLSATLPTSALTALSQHQLMLQQQQQQLQGGAAREQSALEHQQQQHQQAWQQQQQQQQQQPPQADASMYMTQQQQEAGQVASMQLAQTHQLQMQALQKDQQLQQQQHAAAIIQASQLANATGMPVGIIASPVHGTSTPIRGARSRSPRREEEEVEDDFVGSPSSGQFRLSFPAPLQAAFQQSLNQGGG